MDEEEITNEEYEAKAQTELAILEKDLRNKQHERDKMRRQDEIAQAKQRVMINRLKMELEAWRKKLPKEKKAAEPSATHNQEIRQIKKLIKKYGDMLKNVEDEKQLLVVVQSKIKEVQNSMDEMRRNAKSMGRGDGIEEYERNKRVENGLELRLDAEVKKFGNSLEINRNLRNRIDSLLFERERFNKRFMKLSNELQIGKVILLELVEDCVKKYEEKNERETYLSILKSEAASHYHRSGLEFEDLVRNLKHTTRVHDFMNKKSQQRIIQLDQEKEGLQKLKDELAQKEYEAKYSEVMRKIKQELNETNPDRLVMLLMKLDSENYNIYRFVNEQNKNIDILRESVCDTHHKIAQQEAENKENAIVYSGVLKEMEKKAKTSNQKLEIAKTELTSDEEILKELFARINEIYHALGCDTSKIDAMLGENAAVTEYNVKYFLEELEVRLQAQCTISRYRVQRMTPKKSLQRFSVMQSDACSDISQASGGSLLRTILTLDVRDLKHKVVVAVTPCPICEDEQTSKYLSLFTKPLNIEETQKKLYEEESSDHWLTTLHGLEKCRFFKTRNTKFSRRT